MDTVTDPSESRDAAPPQSRRDEFIVFITIAALIWPIVAVGVVGGYGFLVWMSQLILGPPGPPH
ncbi:periplasmic nitrate reductase, NapE protein [Afipia felis]|uniref:Periplasmic nitrate reductase system, NapE component n=2 Tax=Afipia felis TaxID=1035 RepID=A0A380W4E8_AFIFE|nr:periplasmic nitrate reductase, NapE protein [Afipia felis]EKS30959.1 periplasmic nitrate reductase, NapE protein [Afipia felis ATCC 53690]SUU75703.1 Periplasmic nitrate reductase system, NapE component [Afipia felis]SUU83770.1 Periplasmic nitrate reductase system, NapE component [Afipia felis]